MHSVFQLCRVCLYFAAWVSQWYSVGVSIVQGGYLNGTVWVSLWYRVVISKVHFGVSMVQCGYLNGTVWVSQWYSVGVSMEQCVRLNGMYSVGMSQWYSV